MKKITFCILAIAFLSLASACSDSSECKQECVGNIAYTCENGDSVQNDCGSDTCLNGTCIPAHVCDADDIRCDNGVPQKCVSNVWVNQTPCGQNQVCKNGNCEIDKQNESCENGKLQCSPAGIPQKCVDKVWLIQAACTEGMTCKNGICEPDGSSAKICDDDAKQCKNTNIPQKCIGNTWVDQTQCLEGTQCKGGDCISTTPSDNRTPREQLSCQKGEQAKCQTTSDGHVWAVICHDGDVEDDDWVWPEDCSAVGLSCTSEKVDYSDGEGKYMDAWCKCNSDAECKSAYPDENLTCVDQYCDIIE